MTKINRDKETLPSERKINEKPDNKDEKIKKIKYIINRMKKGIIWIIMGVFLIMYRPYVGEFGKQLFLTAGVLCIIYGVLYIFWNYLSKSRAVMVIGRTIKRMAEAIDKVIKKILGKFSMSQGARFSNARYIKGYEDTSEKASANIREIKNKKKRKRFKNMDAIEKIRYIYEKRTLYAIKRGAEIEGYMTPRQVGTEMEKKGIFAEDNKKFIELYNYVRYDEQAVVDEKAVHQLRK